MKKSFLTILLLLCLCFCGCTAGRNSDKTVVNSQVRYESVLNTQRILHFQRYEAFDSMWQLYDACEQLSIIPCIAISNRQSIPTSTRLIDYPRFMDETGFITTFRYHPRKAAVLFSSYAQVWELAGGTVSISVQETIDRQILSGMTPLIVGAASGKDINVELLLSYEPDIVILTADFASHLELAEMLRFYNIPVLVLRVDSFIDYLKMLNIFTTILNNHAAYERNGTKVLDRIDSILEVTNQIEESPNVLFLRAYSYGAKIKGDNHFVSQMISDLGAINIASGKETNLDTLSSEVLLTSDIDTIFISVMGEDYEAAKSYVLQELFQTPAYQALDAVKNHRYFFLPKDYFSFKPNNEWDQAYFYLASLLYPDQFKDFVMP